MIHTVGDLVKKAAESYPDKPAVFHKQDFLTYEQVYKHSLLLAHFLIQSGVKKGDRVCFYLEKRLEKVVVIYGVALAGAVFVPIRRLSTTRQVKHILEDSGADILVTTSTRLSGLIDIIPDLKKVIVVDHPSELPGFPWRVIEWQEIIDGNLREGPLPTVIGSDIATILYTSGSTGRPKGVIFSHQNVISGAYIVSDYLKIRETDRLLSILTFGFDYGLNQLTTSFLKRAQLFLLDYLFPKDILTAVRTYKITGLAAVATTWIQLLQVHWGNSIATLRYVTNSGGSIPEKYVRELRKRIPHADIYLMYGLTEAFRSTYLDPARVDDKPTSIGKPVPGVEIMVLDDNDRPVRPGEVGELVHRGALVSQGYWGDEQSTRERFRRNPLQSSNIPRDDIVVYTGDYGYMDEEGFLYFVGRKDEMIKSAGNRISTTEVEEIVYNSGLVSDAVAFGIPHEIYGQSVYLVVSPAASTSVNPDILLKYCRKKMPAYMVPSRIEFLESLPRNANGKIDRPAIKKMFSGK